MDQVKALIRQFGLIPLSDLEAQNAISHRLAVLERFIKLRNLYRVRSFELSFSARYDNLPLMYLKYNSKGKRRSFGVSLEKQLDLF